LGEYVIESKLLVIRPRRQNASVAYRPGIVRSLRSVNGLLRQFRLKHSIFQHRNNGSISKRRAKYNYSRTHAPMVHLSVFFCEIYPISVHLGNNAYVAFSEQTRAVYGIFIILLSRPARSRPKVPFFDYNQFVYFMLLLIRRFNG